MNPQKQESEKNNKSWKIKYVKKVNWMLTVCKGMLVNA